MGILDTKLVPLPISPSSLVLSFLSLLLCSLSFGGESENNPSSPLTQKQAAVCPTPLIATFYFNGKKKENFTEREKLLLSHSSF